MAQAASRANVERARYNHSEAWRKLRTLLNSGMFLQLVRLEADKKSEGSMSLEDFMTVSYEKRELRKLRERAVIKSIRTKELRDLAKATKEGSKSNAITDSYDIAADEVTKSIETFTYMCATRRARGRRARCSF